MSVHGCELLAQNCQSNWCLAEPLLMSTPTDSFLCMSSCTALRGRTCSCADKPMLLIMKSRLQESSLIACYVIWGSIIGKMVLYRLDSGFLSQAARELCSPRQSDRICNSYSLLRVSEGDKSEESSRYYWPPCSASVWSLTKFYRKVQ